MTGKQDNLAKKSRKPALEVQCIKGIAKHGRSPRALLVELEKASNTKPSKVQTSSETADMEVVTEQSQTESAEHTAWIA